MFDVDCRMKWVQINNFVYKFWWKNKIWLGVVWYLYLIMGTIKYSHEDQMKDQTKIKQESKNK